MSFREDVFIWAILNRPETAKIMTQIFRPEWLETAEYQPILQEIYNFIDEYTIPPSIDVLHEIFRDKDNSIYKSRVKKVLNHLNEIEVPLADALYTIDKARDVAISRSLADIFSSPEFQEMNKEFDGKNQVQEIEKWLRSFQGKQEDLDLDVKTAVEELIKNHSPKVEKIACGIDFIDDWCGGGLRTRNLAIVLGVTGSGKSNCLTIIAHNIAVQDKNVLFISNELTMPEMTERFLSRMSGKKLDDVMEDPIIGLSGLDRLWKHYKLNDRLRLIQVNREIDTNDIEALILREKNLYGWRPDVIVIDFMERMKPTVKGVKRDQSWNWFGYIAKDLVRMAKEGNWLVWTAGQTNRRGYDTRKEQGLEDAQGSIQHLQEAALVVAMRQHDGLPLDDKEKVLLQFKPLKIRHSKKPGNSVLVEAKFGNMTITRNIRDINEWIEEEKSKFPAKK